MKRIKPKWLLGAMVALAALVVLPAAALAAPPSVDEIISPTGAPGEQAAVSDGNNIDVTFKYTSVPMEANTTSVTIKVVDDATLPSPTVVGERTYAYPAIEDTGPAGDEFTGNVTVDASGVEGLYDVVVTVTNHDGSSTDYVANAVIVDNSEPDDVASVTAPPYTNDTTPTFTWVAPDDNGTPPSGIAGYRVEIWDPAGPTRVRGPYTGVTDENPGLGDVQWTLPDADALPPGSYEVRVWAVDRAANESANPGTDSFVIDTTAPVLDQQGPTGYTNDDTPTLTVRFRDLGAGASGYDATNSPLSFTLDGGSVRPPTHNPLDGALVDSITEDVAPAITQGDHTAYIKVQDRAGNTAELTWNFFVDSVAPNGPASVTAPEYTADSAPDFYWPVAEDNGPLAEQSGVGTYTVEIRSTGDGAMLVRGPYTGVTDGNPATPEVDWTLPDALSVEGEYEIWVYSVDNAGNTSTSHASDTFKLDTTSPTLDWEQPANGSWTSDTTPTLSVRFRDTGAGASGYDQAASPTAFTLDGSPLGDPDSEPADGSVGPAYITKGVTTALGDGAHTVSITVEDRVGNSRTYGWTFNVDNTPPSTPTNVTLPDATLDPTPPPAYWTNDSAPKFQWDEATDTGGSGVASYDVEIWVSGGASAEKTYTGVTDQDGGTPGVQWTIPDALTEEIYEVRVYSVDVAGNRSAGYGSTTFGVDITTNPLMLDQESPRDGSFINDATPLLAVRFRDLGYPASGYDADYSPTSFTLDGTPLGDPDTEPNAGDTLGYITKQIASDLDEGSHTVYIAVEDLAGNSADLTWDFFVDTTPPDTPTGVTAPDQTNDPTPAFSWTPATDPGERATGSGVGSYNVEIWRGGSLVLGPYTGVNDQAPGGNVDWTLPDPLPADGAYEIRVWSVDNATNVSETYGSDTFNLDTTAPVLDNQSPTGYINESDPTLSVRFTDSGAGASGYDQAASPSLLELDHVDKLPPTDEPANGATTGNITKATADLLEALHTVEITVADLAGNTASLTWTFTVDMTAPDEPASVTAPEFTNDATPTFAWTAGSDAGSGIASYILEIWTTGAGAAMIRGPYTGITGLEFTIPASDALAPDGDYAVRVWSVDRAGNPSGVYGGAGEGGFAFDTFTLDTGKPVLTNGAPTGLLGGLSVTLTADYADDRSGFAILPPLNPWMRYQDANDGETWTSVGSITGPAEGATSGQIKGESWPGIPITLPNDGTWTVRLTAYDLAGNSTDNPDPYSWTFTVDATPPTFSEPYPAEETTTWDKWTEIRVTITDPLAGDGTAGSGVDGDSLECYIEGPGMIPWDLELESWDPVTGEAVFTQPMGLDLADGVYTARVEAYDLAGNYGSYEWDFEIRQTYAPGMTAEPEFTDGTENTVSWTDVDNEEYYNVEVSEDPSFDTIGASVLVPAGTTSTTFTGLEDGHTYYYRVQAIAYGGRVSLWSNTVSSTQDASGPTAPGTPSTESPTRDKTPTWTWDAATDAGIGVASYYVELSDGSDVIYEGWVGGVTSWTYGTELADGTYYLRVKAKDALDNDDGNWSAQGEVEIDTTCAAPDMTAEPEFTAGTRNTVSWSEVTDDHGPVQYYVECADPDGVVLNSGWISATEFTFEGLGDGVEYEYRVKAKDALGNESVWSDEEVSSTQDDSAPTEPVMDVEPEFTRGTTNTVTWSGSYDTGSGLKHYEMRMATTQAGLVAAIPEIVVDVTIEEFTGLADGQTYYYQVRAVDNVNNPSDWSNIVFSTQDNTGPSVPVGFQVVTQPTDNTPTFVWNASEDETSGVASYVVEYSSDGGGTWTVLDDTTEPEWTATSAWTDGFYLVRAKAIDAVGNESGYCTAIEVMIDTEAPSAPTMAPEPEYTPGTSNEVSWTESVDATSGLDYYEVQCSSSESFDVGVRIGRTTETTYTFDSLDPETTYYYRVKAVDRVGHETGWSASVFSTQYPAAPTMPGLAAEPEFTAGLTNTIYWQAADGADDYDVQVATDEDFTSIAKDLQDVGNVTELLITGLADGTKYFYKVRGHAHVGDGSEVAGPWSNVVFSTQDASGPAAPTALEVLTPGNDSTPTFVWNASDDGATGSGVAEYELQYKSVDDDWESAAIATASEAQYVFPDEDALEDGSYDVRVRAIDKLGNPGGWSQTLTITIDTEAPDVVFVNPTDGERYDITTASTIIAEIDGDFDRNEVWLWVDGTKVAPTAIVGGTVYYVVGVPFAGEHKVSIEVKDAAGNEASAEIEFTVVNYRQGFGFGRLRFENTVEPED